MVTWHFASNTQVGMINCAICRGHLNFMFATLRKARAEEACLLCRAQVTSWNITIGRASHSWIIRDNLPPSVVSDLRSPLCRFAIRHFLLSWFVIRFVFIFSQKTQILLSTFNLKLTFNSKLSTFNLFRPRITCISRIILSTLNWLS